MRPERRPPSNGISLQRTFPKKGNPTKKGNSFGKLPKEQQVRKRGCRGGRKGATVVEKKDAFLAKAFKKQNMEDTQYMISMVHRKCYLLIHGIARIHEGELQWNNEYKNDFFYSRVGLPYLDIDISQARSGNEQDSRMMAAYSFFKYFIATCGLLSDEGLFIDLVLKCKECELGQMAIEINELLLAYSIAFGSSHRKGKGRKVVSANEQNAFDNARTCVTNRLVLMLYEMKNRKVVLSKETDLSTSLNDIYSVIVKKCKEKKGTRKVFESSDDENDDDDGMTSQASTSCGGIVNGEVDDEMPMKKIKREIKCEEKEKEDVIMKRKVKTEGMSEEEMEEKEKKKKIKRQDSKSDPKNKCNDVEDETENENNLPSTSNATSNEFRSNLIDLARDSWSKCAALYSVENEPNVKDRFKMARVIIECLEKKYGDDLLEILQYFTFQSFDPNQLTQKEEVIGLMLYLDQRRLVGENFFFLLLAMNDTESVNVALDESGMCCRAQLKAAKIGKSVLLGKPLHAEYMAANKEAASKRKSLEGTKYHILFPGIIKKNTMKTLKDVKKDEDREMKKEALNKTAFCDEFWMKSSKLFNVDSEWSTYAVNESAVRVFHAMNKMFGGTLNDLIRMMGRSVPDSVLGDPRSGQALTSLYRMKNTGFFDASLFFALIRFNDATAMKKSCNKLSRLCDGFKKVVEAGAKSKERTTDPHYTSIKDKFTERAMKVNDECMQFFEALMSTKGRKRCLSTSSVERVMEKEEKKEEPKNKKRKENMSEVEEKCEKIPAGGKNKIKEEPKEEKNDGIKKKKKKKVKSEETREEMSDEDDCQIIEVDTKKVKMEVISDDEDEKKEKKRERNRRDSKRSADEENETSQIGKDSAIVSVKKEMEEEGETNSSSGWISMGIGEGNMEDDEEDGDERNEYEGCPKLIKFRKRLIFMSDYWSESLIKWKIRSPASSSIDDRYSIARRVIKFYEEEIGEAFHNSLLYKTGVQFTPSDLHEKEEAIALVLYMDKMRFSIAYFFFFILALNDESKVESILESCKETLKLHLQVDDLVFRCKKGEVVQEERNRLCSVLRSRRKDLVQNQSVLFGDIYEIGSEQFKEISAKLPDKRVIKMKSTLHSDGNWHKFAKQFGVKSEWSVYDVCESAVLVFNQLNKLLGGSLITIMNTIYPVNPIDVASINDIVKRTALESVLRLNYMRIFPNGLIFLLLRSKNEKVMEEACSRLIYLTPAYLKFFDDFGHDVHDSTAFKSMTKDRSNELKTHEASLNCMKLLINYIKEGSFTLPLVSLPPSEGSIPPTDQSVWRYNRIWKVTTFWNQSNEWMEWEKRHKSEMDRLAQRIHDFYLCVAMREEHYMEKVKVHTWLKGVLADVMERTESTLKISGSSLCSVGAANSNLDLYIHSAKGNTDILALTEVLKQKKDIECIPVKGNARVRMKITHECTEGLSNKSVSIHANTSTAYMSRVYQMVERLDERVAALSLVLKAWKILDSSCVTSRLQSYHVMCLLIHFLQCGVSPPVLPSLIRLYPYLDPLRYHQNADANALPDPFPIENSQSMGSLLIGFFTYYSHFEFEKYVISIREGNIFKRSFCEESSAMMVIENPYDNFLIKPNNAFTNVEYLHIRSACKKALESLTSSFILTSIPTL